MLVRRASILAPRASATAAAAARSRLCRDTVPVPAQRTCGADRRVPDAGRPPGCPDAERRLLPAASDPDRCVCRRPLSLRVPQRDALPAELAAQLDRPPWCPRYRDAALHHLYRLEHDHGT